MDTDFEIVPKQTFWRRQFAEQTTPDQVWFDIVAGVGLPLICLAFDPIVFRDEPGGGILSGYRFVAYFAIGTCMLSLLAWLFFRRPAGLFVGLLGGGTLLALFVGIVLL